MSTVPEAAPVTPAQGGATPVDFLTVLTCEPDHLLTKTWIADVGEDGAVRPSTKAKYFGVEEWGIDDIGGLLAALRAAATNPRAGIIRGRHLGQEHEARVEPCAHKPKRGSLRRNSCVEDVPHHWVMIDADSWPAGDLLKTEDPRLACIAYIKKELPEEFHGRSFIWQLSSKAGHASIPAGELRVHLWFWLSEPRTSDELKAWAERHMAKRATPPEGADQGKAKPPIDTALFQKIQLHYVANPVMGDGVTDPIETRIGYVRGGLGDEVVLNLDAETASDAKAATAAENERTRGGEWVGPGRKHTLHDPVVAALEERGLVRDSTPGKVILECPWQGDHSTAMHDGDTSTALMRHPFGFSCLHASHRKGAKDEKKLPHLLDFLGIDENAVRSLGAGGFEEIPPASEAELRQEAEAKAAVLAAAEAIVARAVAGDVGAPFEPAAVTTLVDVRGFDQPAWQRIRERLKAAKVRITDLDHQMARFGASVGAGAGGEDRSMTDKVIALARERCRFARTAGGEPFALFTANGARQVFRVAMGGFSEHLAALHYAETDRGPTEAAMKAALATLVGQARHEGVQCEVFTRVARVGDDYWVDLCNSAWQAVRITPRGWSVEAGEGVPLFTRSPGMEALPVPARSGNLSDLWGLVNIPDASRPLLLSWLLECMRPDTPHVLLELTAPAGAAKSTAQRMFRRLIDPNKADIRAAPRKDEDVWVAAANGHVVSFDNMSRMSANLQDVLCVLATGGGVSTRKLYTDGDESIINVCKPVVLNGIGAVVTAADLMDRALHVELPPIAGRRTKAEIDAEFARLQPGLVGALFDLFARALAVLPTVVIPRERLPRMADFAMLGEAVFRAMGSPPGAFLDSYEGVLREGAVRAVEAHPVGVALVEMLKDDPNGFTGELNELLQRLDLRRPWGFAARETWPGSARALGDTLRRLAPSLAKMGIKADSADKRGGVIRWSVRRGG